MRSSVPALPGIGSLRADVLALGLEATSLAGFEDLSRIVLSNVRNVAKQYRRPYIANPFFAVDIFQLITAAGWRFNELRDRVAAEIARTGD